MAVAYGTGSGWNTGSQWKSGGAAINCTGPGTGGCWGSIGMTTRYSCSLHVYYLLIQLFKFRNALVCTPGQTCRQRCTPSTIYYIGTFTFTQARACAHARTHARTHTRTRTHTHEGMRAHSRACSVKRRKQRQFSTGAAVYL